MVNTAITSTNIAVNHKHINSHDDSGDRSGSGAGGERGECVITHLSDMVALSVITAVAISYLCIIIGQHFASVLCGKTAYLLFHVAYAIAVGR